MQGVVGPDGAFTDVCIGVVCIGWPGSMPDAQVLERSALQQCAAAGTWRVAHTEVKLQDLPVVLGACCVLHNLCKSRGEDMDSALLLARSRCDLDLDLDNDGGGTPPNNPVRSDSASKARDEIVHNLLHRGIAGTKFFR